MTMAMMINDSNEIKSQPSFLQHRNQTSIHHTADDDYDNDDNLGDDDDRSIYTILYKYGSENWTDAY